MNNKEKKLDELYKTKLNNFELPVSDKVFANIKQELKLENKKKGFGFGRWLSVIAVVTGLLAGAYFMIKSTNNKSPIANVIKLKETVNAATSPTQATINTNKQIEDNRKRETENKQLNKNQTASLPVNKAITIAKKPDASNLGEEEVKKGLQAENKKFFNNKEVKTSKANNAYKKKANANKVANLLAKNSDTKNDSDNKSKETKTDDDNLNSFTKVDVSIVKKTETIVENKVTDESITKKDSIQKKIIAETTDSLKQNKETPLPNNENVADEKKISFFVGVTGGPSFSFRKLSTGTNEGAVNRNDNEKQITTYNAGVDVGAVLKNKLFANIGIRINNKGEKYNFKAVPTKSDTTYTPIWLDSTHTILIGYDTLAKHTQALPAHSIINKYQYLSIPIMIGYRFNIKDKLFIAPSIGINIDYLLSASSSWVDTKTGKVVYYSKTDGSFSSITLSGKINLDVGWNITNKWSLVLQPGYTRSLQSIYKKDDQLKLYPYSYDFNLAVRFKF